MLLATLAIAAAAPSADASVTRTEPLDTKVTDVRMAVRHRTGTQPPAVLLSTSPKRTECSARGFRYRSINRKGRLRLRMTCSGLTENSRAHLEIRRPYVREFAMGNGTGTVRVKLDKPPGDAVPLVSLTTRPKRTDCETTPKGMHIGKREFRARASVRCRDLPEGTRGELAIGGLLAPDHIDLRHREPTLAALPAGVERRAGRKPCDDPITVSALGSSVTKQVCYTSPTTLGPWQSWYIGVKPAAARAPCQAPWKAYNVLGNLLFPTGIDVEPDSNWWSYYFGVFTNWRAWTDVDASFYYSCYQTSSAGQ